MRCFLVFLSLYLVAPAAAQRGKDLVEVPLVKTGPLAGKPVYASSHAVVIGINSYPNLPKSRWLRYAVRDATEMRDLIVRSYGFPPENVTLLRESEATRENITRSLAALADKKKIRRDDRILIFFSGHGQTVKTQNGGDIGFLIPYDANVDLDDPGDAGPYINTCLRMDTLWGILETSPAKHSLILADACYSGLIATKGGREKASEKTLAKMAAQAALQVITAGRQGEQALEINELGHGAFTAKLLEELSSRATTSGDVFTAAELHSALETSVSNLTEGRQTPVLGNHKTQGQFLFITTNPPPVYPEPGAAKSPGEASPTLVIDDTKQLAPSQVRELNAVVLRLGKRQCPVGLVLAGELQQAAAEARATRYREQMIQESSLPEGAGLLLIYSSGPLSRIQWLRTEALEDRLPLDVVVQAWEEAVREKEPGIRALRFLEGLEKALTTGK